MLFITRIAFGVSFGLLVLGAMTVVAIAQRHVRRNTLLAPRKSPNHAAPENIYTLAAFEQLDHIKRPPFLPQPGGPSLRE